MKRKASIIILSLLLMALMAQEVNAQVVQYYLLPVDTSVPNYRGPLYLKWKMNPDGLDVQWSCKDYGLIDIFICAVNAEQADHDWLAAQAGVYQFPVNIEVNPSPAELAALEAELEASYVPADWLSPSETWRQALRTVTGMFLFMQRLTALTGNTPLDWGVSLNTQFKNLEQTYQDAIIEAADGLGYDSSVLRDNWTLRIILKEFADQWGEQPIYFGFTIL